MSAGRAYSAATSNTSSTWVWVMDAAASASRSRFIMGMLLAPRSQVGNAGAGAGGAAGSMAAGDSGLANSRKFTVMCR